MSGHQNPRLWTEESATGPGCAGAAGRTSRAYRMAMPDIELVRVDSDVLEALVRVAVQDAEADDVTPSVSGATGWTLAREQWLRDYHRSCRSGLDGPGREATWAITVGTEILGAVRLKRLTGNDILETGIWLGRSWRGHGFATAALRAVVQKARAQGATQLRADTAASNTAAQALLRTTGFELAGVDALRRVQAGLDLHAGL